MGRLTRDPILRHTQTNTPVTSFTLAIDRNFGRSEQKQTDFIDIVCWEKLAEFTSKYFVRGLLVAIVGRLQQRQWKDKEGNNRTSYEVVANEAHFAERRQQTEPYNRPSDEFGRPDYSRPAAQDNFAPVSDAFSNAPPPQESLPAPAPDTTGFSELLEDDGELPF
jgi:single-strand DNA-binding protein